MKLNEGSKTALGSDVDDGPRFFYGNQKSYKKITQDLAKKWGREIVDYLVTDEEFFQHDTEYPDGPPLAVSYFPVGDADSEDSGTNYYHDVTLSKSYKDYMDWVSKLADKMGRDIVKTLSQ